MMMMATLAHCWKPHHEILNTISRWWVAHVLLPSNSRILNLQIRLNSWLHIPKKHMTSSNFSHMSRLWEEKKHDGNSGCLFLFLSLSFLSLLLIANSRFLEKNVKAWWWLSHRHWQSSCLMMVQEVAELFIPVSFKTERERQWLSRMGHLLNSGMQQIVQLR